MDMKIMWEIELRKVLIEHCSMLNSTLPRTGKVENFVETLIDMESCII